MFHMKLKKNLSCRTKADMEFQVETTKRLASFMEKGEVTCGCMFEEVG